ncbi:hypothetical protein GSM98_20845 [Rhodococcus rhodochrous]|uniref:hypothetical protein n=1 Tax=Rhodococcus rhodochrous TaxID=1829 RepID=UPI0013267307|nr:hypothetical protein [Rhodococcus pyridinivorans]MXQ78607.1 hypothetical protein [Rhodococcus rhodochrous]
MVDRVRNDSATGDQGDERGQFTRFEDRARDGRARLGIRNVSVLRNRIRKNIALHCRRFLDRDRRRPLGSFGERRGELVRDDGLVCSGGFG